MLVALVLQAITLQLQVGAKSVAILQLAIQGGADVLGYIAGSLRLGDTDLSGLQAGFPGSPLSSQLGLSRIQEGALVCKTSLDGSLGVRTRDCCLLIEDRAEL